MSTTKIMYSNNYYGCGHTVDITNEETTKKIRLEKHRGLWHIIAHKHSDAFPEYKDTPCTFYLCEHEQMGDESACVIIDQNYEIVLDGVWNGFSDLKEYLADFKWSLAVDKFKHVSNTKLCEGFWLSSGEYNGVSFSVIVYRQEEKHYFYYRDGKKPIDSHFEEDYKIVF